MLLMARYEIFGPIWQACKGGQISTRQRMAFRWRANCDPRLHAGWMCSLRLCHSSVGSVNVAFLGHIRNYFVVVFIYHLFSLVENLAGL